MQEQDESETMDLQIYKLSSTLKPGIVFDFVANFPHSAKWSPIWTEVPAEMTLFAFVEVSFVLEPLIQEKKTFMWFDGEIEIKSKQVRLRFGFPKVKEKEQMNKNLIEIIDTSSTQFIFFLLRFAHFMAAKVVGLLFAAWIKRR